MKKKAALSATEKDLLVNTTYHNIQAPLTSEFAERIIQPYCNGNLTAAIQDLAHKALDEQDFALSHTAHVRNCAEAQQP